MKRLIEYIFLVPFWMIFLTPYTILGYEITNLIAPTFIINNISKGILTFITLYYFIWLIIGGFVFSAIWATLFLAWAFLSPEFLFGGVNPFISQIPNHIRLDAVISILFITYYIWEFETLRYLGKLCNIAENYFSKITPISKFIYWFVGKVILYNFKKDEARWLSNGADRKNLYIYFAKIMQDNGRRVWVQRQTNAIGFTLDLQGPNFVLTLPDQISIAFAENVLNGKIPIKNLLPSSKKKSKEGDGYV